MGFRGGETTTVADEENEPVVETKELTVSEEPETDSEQPEGEPAVQTPEDETTEADTEQIPGEEQLPEEENPENVEEVTYGCAVYYYYDGVEDEDARVEAAGAFGDPIFSGTVEKEVVHNEKNYVLDHVENEEGTISEDAEQNVVKVYYVLAEEEEVQKVERSVKVVSSLRGVEIVEEGTSITLTAKLTGFDDVDYEIQWQRSKDGTDWEDVDGANDTKYTFDITEETEGYLWRVSVSTSEA